MACTLQTDSDQWLALFGADEALRQCVAEVFGVIDVQITDNTLTEISLFIGLLQSELARLLVVIDITLAHDACIQVIINALAALGAPTSETNALLADMQARALAVQEQLIELQTAATLMPLQILQQELLKLELECQKANSEFFNNVT
jgi:hypothetical protein